jgi:predicted DNA-binding transcriptional regulator YafY
VGYCCLRQDLRTFRLDRMLQVDLDPHTFSRPLDFDPLEQVERSLANTPGNWTAEVWLQTTLDRARQLIPPALATLEETPQGVKLICYVQDLDWFAHFLAGLDCPWRVRRPPELRQALQNLAERVGEYGSKE